jgi:hypothetical protein
MFRITPETCRTFTFAEVLIMAAMNMEDARVTREAGSDLAVFSVLNAAPRRGLLTLPGSCKEKKNSVGLPATSVQG